MPPPPSPRVAQAFHTLESGNPVEAERQFRQTLIFQRGDPLALYGLALALMRQGRKAEARPILEQAAAALPKDAGCAANLGGLLIELGDHTAAETHLRRATRLDPTMVAAWNNLGRLLMHQERMTEADTVLRKGLALAPDNAQCRDNWRESQDILMHRLEEAGRFDEAIAVADKAIAYDQDWQRARYFRACNLLRLRRFNEGWTDYQTGYDDLERLPLPRWDGKCLSPGAVLLIRAEQGIGEQLMFGRLPHAAQEKTPLVVAECDRRLLPLMARSFPSVRWAPWTAPVDDSLRDPAITHQIPLGRLPGLLDPWADGAPFLVAAPDRIQKARVDWGTDKPVIGLSWASGRSPAAIRKNIPLEALRPLLRAIPARFVILQYEPDAADLETLRRWGVDTIPCGADPMTDLEGFAAAVAACQHVVTISNATAHFAGALGTPTTLLLSANPLWHWFIDGSTSPWYRSLKLYRQSPGQGWDDVIRQATDDLAALVSA